MRSRHRLCRIAIAAIPLLLFAGPPALGQTTPPEIQRLANPYEPYAFLIGEWDTGPEGGSAMAVQRFTWGPNRSYIKFAVSTFTDGREVPHLEGVLMWNGQRRNLDMLLMLDLENGRAQEQGSVSAQADGTIVREVTAISDAGTARARQTFRRLGPDRIATSILRPAESGWVANFPGSDAFVMVRRQPGPHR